jgi:hypothetical protein
MDLRTRFRDVVQTEAELRSVLGSPTPLVIQKELSALDLHTRRFIERSPFLIIATSGPDGRLDVSPRSDPSGRSPAAWQRKEWSNCRSGSTITRRPTSTEWPAPKSRPRSGRTDVEPFAGADLLPQGSRAAASRGSSVAARARHPDGVGLSRSGTGPVQATLIGRSGV